MTALTIYIDKVRTFRNVGSHGFFKLKLITQLVKVRDFKLCACFYRSCVFNITQNGFNQCSFTNTVITHKTDTIATHHQCGEVMNERFVTILNTQMFNIKDQFA